MARQDVLLVLMPFSPSAEWIASVSIINPSLRVECHNIGMYSEELPKEITEETWEHVTVLFTWKTFPTKEMVPNLRYVQLLSAGCNQILGLPLFEDTSIAFCTANGIHPPQIAEWVFSTFLAFQHHIPEYLDNQKTGTWIDPPSDEDTEDAVGLRIGILGYGCVGRQCGRVAKAFGMDVYVYTLHERATPADRKDDSFTEPGLGDPNGEFPTMWFHGKEQLNDFLGSDLDLLVITLPLTPATQGMLGAEQFQVLGKKKAYISNVGRGAVIKTDDLVKALDAGLVRGAALDVTDPEPLPAEHKLWRYKNVIITPHCAGNSNHYYERALGILSYNLRRLSQGQGVVNRVNKSLGY